jgi:hypothetical protein
VLVLDLGFGLGLGFGVRFLFCFWGGRFVLVLSSSGSSVLRGVLPGVVAPSVDARGDVFAGVCPRFRLPRLAIGAAPPSIGGMVSSAVDKFVLEVEMVVLEM